MALPLAIPSSPEANSPSTDGSNGPRTPVSPTNPVQTLALPPPVDGTPANANNANNAQAKRKPSRRANTAERRATHNAVERQRRETLNGRFLDLAALLPNLSQIRRPSKSSIVNSSIAHIHASRRHRVLAARELRLLKLESDALRRELNEWRDRSGLPRVEEPVRGDAFQMIMSGEVEVLNAGPIEEEDGGDYGGDDYGDDDYVGGNATNQAVMSSHGEDAVEDMRNAATVALMKNGQDVNSFAHSVPNGPHAAPPSLQLQTVIPRGPAHMQSPMVHSPMVVQSPTGVSFENPAMPAMYDPMHVSGHHYYPAQVDADKPNVWNAQLLNAMGSQQALFTPPASAHGQQQAAFYMNVQRQQALHRGGMMYGSPADSDDNSSVGSAPGISRRERSGSMGSAGSGGYGSPGSNTGSLAGSYEMQNGMIPAAGNTSIPRRMTTNWDEGMNGGLGLGMMKSQPVSVGGGPTHGFAAAMML